MTRKFLFLITFVLIIIACNVPAGIPPTDNSPDLAETITAQALLLQNPFTATPTPAETGSGSLPEANVQSAAATPQTVQSGSGVLPASTFTPGTTTVTVSVETNCRKGPSTSYTSVYSLPVGKTADVVGKNTNSGYWIINIPGNAGSTCWLWGKYATVNGNTGGLAEIAIPVSNTATATIKSSTATATATLPASSATSTTTATLVPAASKPVAPSNISFSKACIDQGNGIFTYQGTFTWNDNSNNENGFNVYLNGPSLSVYDLPANTKSLYINPDFPEANAVTFRIEAYNNSGVSPSVEITITCP